MILAVGYALVIAGAIVLVAVARAIASAVREVTKWDRRNR